jgi:predicted nucleotidyltransferase
MEQKRYKYEIILNLLKGDNHLRQIAKELLTNHMTIKRALDRLTRENVLDVRSQGKNNVHSIKQTIEAKNSVLMSEIYKFNRLIERHPELKHDIRSLQKMSAKLIVIFGSYAKGRETNKSDVDVYIETVSKNIKNKAEKINRKFSVKIGGYDKGNLLIREIEKNHVIIKGVERFYEKNQFFE